VSKFLKYLGEKLPFAFQGDGVLSVRELIKLIRDYPIRIEKELRKAELGMIRSGSDTLSKKTLTGLYVDLREKVLCVPSSE
jgi:hypothetical protein